MNTWSNRIASHFCTSAAFCPLNEKMRFTGYIRLRIREAEDLKPTSFSTRHTFHKKTQELYPYIVIKVDNFKVDQTAIKPRTNHPVYDEDFCHYVCEGKMLELAVFHDTPIGYDDFVANCTIQLESLLTSSSTRQTFEGWVRNSSYIYIQTLHKPRQFILYHECTLKVGAPCISI